jgi:hypothetical protein
MSTKKSIPLEDLTIANGWKPEGELSGFEVYRNLNNSDGQYLYVDSDGERTWEPWHKKKPSKRY